MRPAPILLALTCLLAPPPASAFALAVEEDAPVAALSSAYAGAVCGRDLPKQDDSAPAADDDRRASAKDPCAVADNNLARAEAEILKGKPPVPAAPYETWDHNARPQFLEAILRRFELQPAELAVIKRAGFAVPARLEVGSYTHGYHRDLSVAAAGLHHGRLDLPCDLCVAPNGRRAARAPSTLADAFAGA